MILLSGHHDSAYEFPLFRKLGEKSFLVIISCIVITLLNMLLGLFRTVFILMDGSLIISDPFQFLREIQTNNLAYVIDLVQVLLFFIGIPQNPSIKYLVCVSLYCAASASLSA